MRAAVIPRTYLWVLASMVVAASLSACKPRPTPITPQSYQTIPVAVDPSATLVYLDVAPDPDRGGSVWILTGDATLGQSILQDPALQLRSVSGAKDPRWVESRVGTLRYYRVRVDEQYTNATGWYGYDERNGMGLHVSILQTDHATYLVVGY